MTIKQIDVLCEFKELLSKEGKIELYRQMLKNPEAKAIMGRGFLAQGNMKAYYNLFPEEMPEGWEPLEPKL